MKKTAIVSQCGKYRYQLGRIWDKSLPYVLFIMHNPSTADADTDDPTIRRCINFAKHWGYGGILVGNLSPYKATKPSDMKDLPWSIISPSENITHINLMVRLCNMHIMAFGNPIISDLLPDYGRIDDRWHYLKLTMAGNPGHPLYLKRDLKPIRFNLKNGQK